MNTILTSTSGGLDAAAIEPFFYSLRLSGYKDNVVVFTGHISDDCRALLKDYQATVIDFDYRGIPTLHSRTQRLLQGSKSVYKYYRSHRNGEKDFRYLFFNNARFFYYYDYLLNVPDKPGLVLLADVRDVIFQADPFRFPFQPGLSVATECTRRTIRQSACAVKGLLASVGLRELCRIARRHIICAGTTMADYDTWMKYLDLITCHIKRRFFWALLEGIDQNLHMYFVYNRLVTPVHRYLNWKGPFLTLDREVVRPENKNRDGYLCNEDGSVVPIVHQYDRIRNLFRPEDARPPCWKLYK